VPPAPRVNLDYNVHWCPRHLEPLRANWPTNSAVAMVYLVEAALAHPTITAAVPKDADGHGQVCALDVVLLEHSPLCCLLGDDGMAALWKRVFKT
jgi:hypothetical protein